MLLLVILMPMLLNLLKIFRFVLVTSHHMMCAVKFNTIIQYKKFARKGSQQVLLTSFIVCR